MTLSFFTLYHFWVIFILATLEYFSFWNFLITALNFFWHWQSCSKLHISLKHFSKVSRSGFWSSSRILIYDFLLKMESVKVMAPKTKVCVLKCLYMFAIVASSSKNLHIWRFFCESLVNTSYFLMFLSFYHLSLIASRRLRVVV